MWLKVVLLLALLALTFAADGSDSCKGRCNKYDRDDKCKCNVMCKHWKDCCADFDKICGKLTLEDMFAEDDGGDGELFEGPTPSPGRSAHGQSFNGIKRRLKPTQGTISDFGRRPQQLPQASDSCEGRCNVYDRDQPCQCEKTCKHYKNCCSDYEDVCVKPTLEDTFAFAEDDEDDGVNRRLKPTQRPISDFGRRPQQDPQNTLRMTRPHRLMDTIPQEAI